MRTRKKRRMMFTRKWIRMGEKKQCDDEDEVDDEDHRITR